MTVPKIVVHSDIIRDHVSGLASPSVLRRASALFFCYTTVFQAIELFSGARGERERRALEDAMSALKILGLNARNAPRYGRLFATQRGKPLTLLAAGICVESRLPILTAKPADFRGIPGLLVVSPELIARYASGARILKVAARK